MMKNRIPYKTSKRRRGQALLLSVLIMIFIVLLGTTFIAIVASNLSNIARTSSKDQARLGAQAGIDFADAQLTGSPSGLDWRPENVNTPPTASDPTYSYYWSSLDRAQDWDKPSSFYFDVAQNGSTTPAQFVKFPNPLQPISTGNASHYMIRVSQVRQGDPDNNPTSAYSSKTGDIRIESIGFANDDPAAFYRMVAYKQGPGSNPLTAAMRSVTNWDFTNNAVPQGEKAVTGGPGGVPLGSSIQLSDTKGYFDPNDCPFYVTIAAVNGATNVVGAIVNSVSYSGTTPTLNLNGSVTVNMSAASGTLLVQKAAGLGAPATVNFDNATATNVDYRISTPTNSSTNAGNSGSVWINGGLVWFGNSVANNLEAASSTQPGSYIKVSGLFAPDASAPATVNVTQNSAPATVIPLPSSSLDASYTSNAAVTNGLLDDGLNRLRGSLEPTRQVQPFTPPDITAGGDGFGRYRQLTQYSTSTDPSNPQASAYGYGQGIYINNPTDVEKVGSTPMTQKELHDLWFTPGAVPTDGTVLATSYERSQVPALPTSTTNSLEEQHLRGWVSPDQFLPRGAEVIINNNNTITVNLDPLDDNSAAYPKANFANSAPIPNPAKGWRNPDGTIAGDATNGGVYSQTYNWPNNGTLFAEGNIRIRGVDANATSSLTVVSMNNIYIDGSLKLGNNKKVLLLAKKNVIANPTLTLQPIQAVTTLSAPTVGGTKSISVYDLSNFQIGDYITIVGSSNIYGVSGKSTPTGAGTITLSSSLAATSRPAGSVVQTVFDPKTDVGYYTNPANTNRPYITALRLSTQSDIIQRRIQWPDNTTNIRLAFRHSAEYRKALEVDIQQPTTAPNAPTINTATLTNKIKIGATSPQNIIQAADKAVTVTYDEIEADGITHNTGTDTFLTTQPADQATAAGKNLNALVTDMTSKHSTTQWNYNPATTVVDPNYAAAATQPPYYFLASSGSRYPFPAQYTPQPTPGTPNAYPPASEPSEPVYPKPSSGVINIPMATSVWTLLNNVQTPLSLIPGLDIVNQFGFSPIFIDSTTPQNEAEDVLTTDQYFYQPHATTAPDATYSHYFPGIPDDDTGSGTYPNNYFGQNQYDAQAQYTLDSRTLTNMPSTGNNELVLQQNNATVDATHTVQQYFTSKTGPTDTTHYPMPFYRLSNLKLQNETFDGATPPNLNAIGTGTTFDINAYVYAQEGGWYVIPGTNFDQSTSLTDPNNVHNNDDLNRDGVISQGESVAAYRYHRYNYQIVFTGAIMENQTASSTDVGLWMDKWATVKMTDVTATPTYDSANPANPNSLGDILYYYDPTAAQGALSTDVGFHVPVATGGLIYQG